MGDLWFVFVWCAVFSCMAAGFQKLLDLLAEKRHGESLGAREVARLLVELTMVGFYGGLSGWALLHVFPGIKTELLGIFSALLGSGGPRLTRRFLVSLVERAFGVKVELEKEAL